ncbi:dTDP-4-dehydrorhamnose reductase [Erwinia rhapontici]|uniref:dTDP-4-dehydrorhamnose reductase n=1 Tax=Erwinia TaxID=551 RepID=UPI0013311EFA|nr:dTDP-4-dehydrorhamnose reductase [Erwinia rhapontici]MBP2156292.1 dTDP-4-dehydrorhamnose reductase [Erwinia rhapontici]NKG30029.1 dTDP-4-dehydrorhamnose reductase [Erwinia rhapontici]
MKVLLTGAKGQLGRCFSDCAPESWKIYSLSSAELDITNGRKVEAIIRALKPNFVVNAAGYTQVDQAESQQFLANAVNRTGPENLARGANSIGARLVHVSTDYVFDGKSQRPYLEDDKTAPLNVYGKTKLEGEAAVLLRQPEAIVLRTSWVFSEYGNNFVKTMLRLAATRKILRVVGDQLGCPTDARDIAMAIIMLLKAQAPGGIYHFSGSTMMSWYDFARQIIDMAAKNELLNTCPELVPIATSEYPFQAVRPLYSVLDTHKIAPFYHPSTFDESLRRVIFR